MTVEWHYRARLDHAPISGVCCYCGHAEEEETECDSSEDEAHCEHWWDGPDEPAPAQPASGAETEGT